MKLSFHKRAYATFKLIKDYKTPIIVKPNLTKLKTIFPPGIDYSLIKMTDVGLYSVTHWRTTLHLIYEMEQFMKKEPKELTITDATAGVGGDTLCFAQRFNNVNAVELDSLHCSIVAHNLLAYKKRKKVNLICANYVDVVGLYKPWPGTPITQNVIYFDPPWGGPKYKTRNTVILKLDNIPLSQIIWHILFHTLATYIFIIYSIEKITLVESFHFISSHFSVESSHIFWLSLPITIASHNCSILKFSYTSLNNVISTFG